MIQFPSMVLPSSLVTAVLTASQLNTGTAKSTITIKRDGSIITTVTGNLVATATDVPAAWARLTSLSNLGDAYSVRFLHLSGAVSVFAADDTWFALSSDREFGIQRSTLGTSSGSAQVQISPDGGVNVIQAFTVSYTSGLTSP